MYYPNLMNMKLPNRINKKDIKLLDQWLVRIPYRNRNNLNHLHFSLDEGINEESAFRLFVGATLNGVEVLKLHYNIVTDDKMQSLGLYDNRNVIPDKIYNHDSGTYVYVKDSNIELRFELTSFPEITLSNTGENKKVEVPTTTLESVKEYKSIEDMLAIFK